MNDIELSQIKLVASDCDGVLTDGGMYYLDSGDEMKKFCVLDGVGFLLLHKSGIKTAIITSSDNPMIRKRAEKLNVDHLITGEEDKLSAVKRICELEGLSLSNVAYIGDDIYDIPAIRECGFGCVPGNALDYIKREGKFITRKGGGEGCFREVVDHILGIGVLSNQLG